MAKPSEDQRCQFLIGPVSSWFMPNAGDIWSKPKKTNVIDNVDKMDCEDLLNTFDNNINLSYFIYGSIGCFCYGQIHHNSNQQYQSYPSYINQQQQQSTNKSNSLAAIVNRLIHIKEDNSRVACVRFLKTSAWPMAMILTESGSFIIHDCLSSKNLIHLRKSELISKFGLEQKDTEKDSEPSKKKAKFNVTQQINSFVWPNATNVFLGVSLVKEKTIMLFWIKIKDLSKIQEQVVTKTDLIESFQKVNLELNQYCTPISCMDSITISSSKCLIAIATDDGLITVVDVNLETGNQSKSIIKLPRHNDQVCSMSFFYNTATAQKFPLGLLGSVSRDGLTLIWDIENEFNFADYQATSEAGKFNSKINWYSLSFIDSKKSPKRINLALSNPDNNVTLLEVPENARSKIRLKGRKQGAVGGNNNHTLRHHGLLFNVTYNPLAEIVMTSSLDGNHLFWDVSQKLPEVGNNNRKDSLEPMIELRPQYLYASMPNNSRTHMLRFSPIKENLVAMAIGKAGLRFHNISNNPMNHRFDMNPSCGLIVRKINKASLSPTSVAWHPSNEYRIAIGTLEGKVLRADLTPRGAVLKEAEHKDISEICAEANDESIQGKQITEDLFGVDYKPIEHDEAGDKKTSTKTTTKSANNNKSGYKTDGVYSMSWGPNPTCPDDISRLAIYAIGSISNRLFIYQKREKSSDKLTNYLDDFHDKSLPEALGQSSEVAWKSTMDLMALGTTRGKIIIVSFNLNIPNDSGPAKSIYLFNRLATIEGPLGETYIQCLVWHPTTNKDDPYYYCLASSANESPAYIFNVRENVLVEDVTKKLTIKDSRANNGLSNNEEINYVLPEKVNNSVSSYIHKLDGHKKAISDIAWNPHRTNELATSSFDRQCHVWSLMKQPILCGNIESNDYSDDTTPTARIISTFTGLDRLFTVEWSLVDDDLILTSGHDSTVWAWRSSENLPIVKL